MKNKLKFRTLFILTFVASGLNTLSAQWGGTNPLTTTSNVGIATSSPQASFHVSPTYTGGVTPMLWPLTLLDYTQSGSTTTVFTALNNGKVGIGTNNPTHNFHLVGTSLLNGASTINGNAVIQGSLTVNNGTSNQFQVSSNGFLVARQIDVNLSTIPDYVFHAAFDQDSASHYKNVGLYKPMSLGEVGTFVKTYRHLPGIKSAADYEKEGSVNVGELQIKLLEKVEELTLYNIKLMQELEELKKKQAELEKVVNQQKN